MLFMAKKVVSVFAKERVKFLILSFFISLGILIPLHHVYGIFGIMGGIADAIGKAIAGIILAYMLQIPTAILWLSSLILGWSIDPLFIRVPYTSGGIIDIGWPVTRDLANMGIVLVLVFIGLATALRLKEYQAQRTLPLLIGVALLINFTPVILGVIVDGANIVMRFFLDGLTGGQIVATIFSNISTIIAEAVKNVNFFSVIEFIGILAAVLMIGAFMIFASIIFLLFAALFMIRKIAIWILVILSPLAFVAYILPGTRGIFRMWWNQFIQWTIIGIFAAFFLWLGNHMIGMAARGGLTGAVSPSGGGIVGDAIAVFLNASLPYMVALIFLLIGFFAALSTSAMGASGIIAGVQKGTRTLTKAAGAAGVGTVRGVPAVSRAEARIRQRLERGEISIRGRTVAIPGISALVGGPGAYDAELKRDREKAGRNLPVMSNARLRDVMESRTLTRDDRLRKARAFELLVERNRIEQQDYKHWQEAQTFGVPPPTVYNKMPNWETTPKAIRERVERQETREFRRNIQPQAFGIVTSPPPGAPPGTPSTFTSTPENLEVFYSIDTAKATELGRTGNRQQKEALRRLVQTQTPVIMTRINTLVAAGSPDNINEAKKLYATWREVVTNPNYQT